MAIGGYGAGVFTTKSGLPLVVISRTPRWHRGLGMIIGLPALGRAIY